MTQGEQLTKRETRQEAILRLVHEEMEERMQPKPFVPGVSPVPYSGTVAGGEEFAATVRSMLTGWFGAGEATKRFEQQVAEKFGRKRKGIFVNSGSSANLVSLAALTSRRVPPEKRLERGDEVVTCVTGFPTTLNPLLQYGMSVNFVDTSLPTYNPTGDALVDAVSHTTKALVFAHTVGNPYDMRVVMDLVRDYKLRLIEDCCDALGSTYEGRPVGSFGDFATCSFYPAHHVTTGEGGMVMSDQPQLLKVAESFRDWGRSCWCPAGHDNTCGKRFGWKLGDLPEGYDHKYVYDDIGYNLKPLEWQAAFGVEQMKRADAFVEARRRNFRTLSKALQSVRDLLVLPEATKGADPSWWSYPITLQEGLDRRRVVASLDAAKVHTRMLFGGNMLRQPAYAPLKLADPAAFPNADRVMNQTFFVGVSPLMTEEMATYAARAIAHAAAEAAVR